jgi:hypothetical protein
MRTWRACVKDKNHDTYLWGGAELRLTLVSNLVLLIQVDEDGERTQIVVVHDLTRYPIGFLQPSEQIAIPLNGIQAVIALGDESTYINCEIISSGTTPEAQLQGIY